MQQTELEEIKVELSDHHQLDECQPDEAKQRTNYHFPLQVVDLKAVSAQSHQVAELAHKGQIEEHQHDWHAHVQQQD